MQDLVATLGSVERPAIVKALVTWVELGVLKEDSESVFKLLNVAAVDASSRTAQKQPGARLIKPRSPWVQSSPRVCFTAVVVEEVLPVMTVQQQQAEQMKVFWKVSQTVTLDLVLKVVLTGVVFAVVHRRHAEEPWVAAARQDSADAQICTWL